MMNHQRIIPILFLVLSAAVDYVIGFQQPNLPFFAASRKQHQRVSTTSLPAAKGDGKKGGYKFGDLSKAFAKRASARVNQLTGNENYEFGDLSRWLDQQAKGKAASITGKDEYKFGDLTLWADKMSKEKVGNFTDKEGYEVGDISKEVIRRVRAGDYELQDVFLALRILLSAGASLTPVAGVLPVKVLLELVNLGLAQDLTGRLVGVLAGSLDERVKEAITGDANYQLGDLTKKKTLQALADFTGKDSYEFGDISRKVTELSSQQQDKKGKAGDASKTTIELLGPQIDDLAVWDNKFQERSGATSLPSANDKD